MIIRVEFTSWCFVWKPNKRVIVKGWNQYNWLWFSFELNPVE